MKARNVSSSFGIKFGIPEFKKNQFRTLKLGKVYRLTLVPGAIATAEAGTIAAIGMGSIWGRISLKDSNISSST